MFTTGRKAGDRRLANPPLPVRGALAPASPLMSTKTKDPKKGTGKPRGASKPGINPRLAQQTRKQLAKHYASKYKVRPR